MSIINTRLSAFFAALLISVATVAVPQAAIAQTDAAPAAEAAPAAVEAAPAVEPAATDAASEAPVDAALPVAGSEAADNPYGIEHLWAEGGLVGQSTLIILIIMSVGSWYIIITKLIDQMKIMGQATDAKNKFWKAGSVQAGVTSLKEGSPFRYIAEAGTKATDHHEGALLEKIDLSTWITMAVQRAVETVQSRLQNGLSFLATVGSTAPFIGLFGTVVGIMKALVAIGTSGQASIDKVAGPVGEALLMTAFGLFVAVPAVLGYNWLIRRNKSAMEEVRSFGADVHMVLVSGTMNTSETARAAGAKKVA